MLENNAYPDTHTLQYIPHTIYIPYYTLYSILCTIYCTKYITRC